MLQSTQQFEALQGCKVYRSELEQLLNTAKAENNTDVIYRVSSLLNKQPAIERFEIEVEQYLTALNAPKHSGIYKEALDECGRLRKGFKFENGSVVKVEPKKVVKKETHHNPILESHRTTPRAARLTKEEKKKIFTANKKAGIIKSGNSYNPIAKKSNKKPLDKISPKPKPTEKKATDIFNLPVAKIIIDKTRFQNRNKLNETVLDQIVNNYSTTKLDPVIVWKDKNGKTYLLAGHHRLEATERVDKKTIPAKYFQGTEAEAIKYAKFESNANRSLELPQERAKLYREMRKEGKSKTAIKAEADKLEGKNASYILNLSYLEPNGIVMQSLNALSETSEKQNATLIERIADWIGEVRRMYDLTALHEKEMFDFLQDREASKRFKNKAEFKQKITAVAGGFYFDSTKPLNLKRLKYKTEGEQVYDSEYKELKQNLDELLEKKAAIKDKIINPDNPNYVNPKSKEYDTVMEVFDNAIAKINSEVKHFQKKILELERSKGKYTNAGSNQVGLFGPKKPIRKPKPLKGIVDSLLINMSANSLTGSEPISANPKIKKIGTSTAGYSEFFNVAGEVGKFLQQVEKKPVESVVITLDGEQGAGKTTTVYKFMDAFATPGNKCLFISAEEHPESHLAIDKANKLLSDKAKQNIDIIGEVCSVEELYKIVAPYDIIFIDSWQKLQRMVGNIRLDEDLRKKFNGKVFVVIFQQTTTGRTKGGAEVVFDGDIIIKMVKCNSFADNYAYFDKNRYTQVPLETLRYNIATGTTYNPQEPKQDDNQELITPLNLSFSVK